LAKFYKHGTDIENNLIEKDFGRDSDRPRAGA
jgi:hypothetical protein